MAAAGVRDGRSQEETKTTSSKWSWLKKPVVWAIVAIATPALGAVGLHLESGGLQVARHMAGADDNGVSRPATGSHALLGVNMTVNYTDQDAVALAGALKNGPGYTKLLKGITDNGYGSGWGPFLQAYGGAPVGTLHMDLVLTGEARSQIRVTNVRIQMVKPPQPELSGTYIPIQHEGGHAAFKFAAHLDSLNPVITGIGGQQSFPDFNISLDGGEQTTISIDFFAEHYTYSWVLDIDYLQGTTKRTIQVTNPGGRPFVLTAAAARYRVIYASNFPGDGYRIESP